MLDLAARGLRNRPRLDEPHVVGVDIVHFGDGAPNCLDELARARCGPVRAFELCNDHEPLLTVGVDAERRAASRPDRWMHLLDRALDVRWIVILSGDDDEVLDARDDEQLSAT